MDRFHFLLKRIKNGFFFRQFIKMINNPTYAKNHLNRIDNENPVGEVRQNIKIRFAIYLKFCAKNIFHVSWFLQLFFQLATINETLDISNYQLF